MAWFRRTPPTGEPPAPDLPEGFGYKMAWVAARTDRPDAVARALELRRPRPANWAEGVGAIYARPAGRAVFVTPPLPGVGGAWVLAAGWALAPLGRWCDVPRVAEPLLALSAEFGAAHYFFTYRVSETHVWARADSGRLRRGFGTDASHDLRWDVGRPTRAERRLRLVFPNLSGWECDRLDAAGVEWPDSPGEDHVMRLAAAWSLDPSTLDKWHRAPGVGLLGELP